MKDMSVKELIVKCGVGWNDFKAELLQRYEELGKENELWRNSRDGIMAENEALAAAAIEQPPYKEDLMCCGNCVHLQTRQCSRYDLYARSGEWPPACEYCNKWHDDGLTREEREGK